MKLIAYFQGVAAELKKVQWPTAGTVLRYFVTVVLGVTLAALVIFGLDTLFIRGLSLFIK